MDSMSHIELTEEEKTEAIINAKMLKEERLKYEARKERAAKNREALSGVRWSYSQTESYMEYRGGQIFDKPFKRDANNNWIFTALCLYFSEDDTFISLCKEHFKIKQPSLKKGLLLYGGFGTGKTWMAKLFQKNQRQVYHLKSAKDIAAAFQSDGEESLELFTEKYKNPYNDPECFYQQFSGLCIDDLGTEDIKNHFGNKKNVIADIFELRYSKGNTGVFLHATTNLTYKQIEEFYGLRVMSRLHEMFNFIEMPGIDRRK